MIQTLGWIATALVVGSYFCARHERLRLLQMCGAVLWAVYGMLIGSAPVIVANVLVLSAAAWTRKRRAKDQPALRAV